MSAEVSTPEPGSWFQKLRSRRPHQVIRCARGEYLRRWFLVPQKNRFVNVYLHKFVGSDDPTALHNHPWRFLSLVLSGAYVEVTEHGTQRRSPFSVAYRPAHHRHRIQLIRDQDGERPPCLSVVITGAHQQGWGFFCPPAPPTGAGASSPPGGDFTAGGCGDNATASDHRSDAVRRRSS